MLNGGSQPTSADADGCLEVRRVLERKLGDGAGHGNLVLGRLNSPNLGDEPSQHTIVDLVIRRESLDSEVENLGELEDISRGELVADGRRLVQTIAVETVSDQGDTRQRLVIDGLAMFVVRIFGGIVIVRRWRNSSSGIGLSEGRSDGINDVAEEGLAGRVEKRGGVIVAVRESEWKIAS